MGRSVRGGYRIFFIAGGGCHEEKMVCLLGMTNLTMVVNSTNK